jgi:hypothetical protein
VAPWAVRPLPQGEGGAAGHGGRMDRRALFNHNL